MKNFTFFSFAVSTERSPLFFCPLSTNATGRKTNLLSFGKAVLALVLMLSFVSGWGQMTFTSGVGMTQTQNFDGLPTNVTNNNINTARIGQDWYWYNSNTATQVQALTGNIVVGTNTTSTAHGMYNCAASTTSTDRSVGSVASGSGAHRLGVNLINNTGSIVAGFDLSFRVEKYRNGSSTAVTERVLFEYSTNATSLSTGTWTAVSSLDLVEPSNANTDTSVGIDGNAAGNFAAISGSISGLSINNSTGIWIRWRDTDEAGTDALLALDNVSITALPNNYSVIYNGNLSTGGTAPTDASSPYAPNSTVTVLGNTGSLTKTGFTYNNWNTATDGSGTPYSAGNTFTINKNTTLYAQWVSNTPILNHTGTNTINHGSTCLNVAATKQSYTVTNTGGAAATGVTITSNNTEFAVSNISATTIASGGSITYDVTFIPTVAGTRNATITVNNAENVTISNNLSGVGTAPVAATPTTNAAANIATNTATLNGSAVFGVCPSTTGKGFVIAKTVDNPTPTIGGTGVTDRTVILGSAGAYTFAETGLSPNTSYTYRAYLTDGTTPVYGAVIQFTTLTPPANDLCSDAKDLVVNDPAVSGTLVNSTFTSPFLSGKDVWYKFTPDCNGKFTINLMGSAGSANIQLYSACNTITSIQNTTGTGANKILTTTTTLTANTIYYVRVVAGDTAAESSTFTISVNSQIAIVTQPVDATVNAGTTAQFSVSTPANQTGRQWQVLTTAGGAVWTDIPSATGTPYTTPSTTMAMNGYKYRVIISNGTCQTITSNEALLTVNPVTVSTDMFRSKVSGDWDAPTTWISSSDGGITWLDQATAKPTGSAASIEIMNGHTVKTFFSEGAKDLTVHSGGILDLNASLTNSGLFKIEDNGTVNIKYTSSNLSTNLWAGTEDFAPNSLVRVTLMAGSGANLFTVSAGVPAITARTYSGYTALFGFLELLPASGWSAFLPNLADYNLTHNDLTLTYSTASNFSMISGNSTTMGIGRDFITNIGASVTTSVTFQTGAGSSSFNVRGNYIKKGTGVFTFSGANVGAASPMVQTFNIDGNLKVENGSVRMVAGNSGGVNFEVNLKGNLEVTAGQLFNNNQTTYATSNFNFIGTNQTINYTGATKPSYIYFCAKNGSNVQLINQDFTLDTNSKFTVESGATLDFGFNGTTALNLLTGTGTGQKFELKDGGTLKITSPVGISNGTSVYTGNVQIGATSANRVFGAAGIYHYIGKENQVSGNGLPSTAGDKKVIVELANDDLKFWATPESGAGSVKRFTSGGGLEIRSGTVYDGQNPDYLTEDHGRFADAVDTGATIAQSGNLTMTGGRYVLYHNAVAAPHLSGNYNLTGGVIQFDGNDQSIRAINSSSVSNEYLTVEVTGKNIGTPAGNITLKSITSGIEPVDGSLKIKGGGEFLINDNSIVGTSDNQSVIVENGGVFKTGDAHGFSGSAQTSVQPSIENIILQPSSTIEYSRTGDQTITNKTTFTAHPDYANLKISGTGTKSAAGETVVKEKTILANAAVTLKVPATADYNPANPSVDAPQPNVFYANGGIDNGNGSNGIFLLENNAMLMQNDDAVNNNAKIQLLRNAKMKRLDYTYWGSPVQGQIFKDFSPNTVASRFYSYNEIDGSFSSVPNYSSTSFVPGQGYAIRASNTANSVTPELWPGKFIGKPNNGDAINFPLKYNTVSTSTPDPRVSAGLNMIANPYPSNIDLRLLRANNSGVTDGVFYFWTNTNAWDKVNMDTTNGSYGIYKGNNYATLNMLGSTPATGAAQGASISPSAIIKPGQGFLIHATKEGPLNFSNSIRTTDNKTTDNNSVFFNGKNSGTLTPEVDRFWLYSETPTQLKNVILIGYATGANNGFDSGYDAITMGESDSFYSIAEDKKLVIQGRIYPLVLDDVVSLGLAHYKPGTYKIGIEKRDGIFASAQHIYLKDQLTGIITDLTEGSYTYTADAGESNTRFEIIYQPQATLAADVTGKDDLQVYVEGSHWGVKSLSKKINGIEVYDHSGRLVLKTQPHSNLGIIEFTHLPEGVFILKIDRDGMITSRKVIR
ncbi:MAG: InlB B-repeat-containing protein [Bacteroidetes bacterium]|nr:InlB B-repeat-containing protein [Bacteroidota bacterium]